MKHFVATVILIAAVVAGAHYCPGLKKAGCPCLATCVCKPCKCKNCRCQCCVKPQSTSDTEIRPQGITETPEINIPAALRVRNWNGRQGQGSCLHASTIHLLNWARLYDLAKWWRTAHGDGTSWSEMSKALNAAGVKWAGTYGKNDVAFLEWAIKTRRGCMVTTNKGEHMINLVDLDADFAYLLDNNDEQVVYKLPRKQFLQEWAASYSWATAIVYTPPPPVFKRGAK